MMKLVDEIFAKCKIKDISHLIGFGFNETKDGTLLFESQIEPEMRLKVDIRNGRISGTIIDENFNDEFVQIDDESNAYAKMLNEKCRPLLLDIKEKCFEKSNFLLEQSLRVERYILEKYKVDPEFLWSDSPGFGVFRNPDTKKWFGIIMDIDRSRFKKGSSGKTEIINLKLDNETERCVKEKGIYPAYHMNKKNWVSVELNGDVADDYLFGLVSISYRNS